MKILVVDDEKGMERLFQQRFRHETRSGRIKLYFAYSGEEALCFLSTAEAKGLHLILSDINMPKIDGLELLSLVRTEYPSIKVIIITAFDDHKKRDKALCLGASDYLVKPLSFHTLKERIFAR